MPSRTRRRHGVRAHILQSTPAGFRLYERMGFRTITRVCGVLDADSAHDPRRQVEARSAPACDRESMAAMSR